MRRSLQKYNEVTSGTRPELLVSTLRFMLYQRTPSLKVMIRNQPSRDKAENELLVSIPIPRQALVQHAWEHAPLTEALKKQRICISSGYNTIYPPPTEERRQGQSKARSGRYDFGYTTVRQGRQFRTSSFNRPLQTYLGLSTSAIQVWTRKRTSAGSRRNRSRDRRHQGSGLCQRTAKRNRTTIQQEEDQERWPNAQATAGCHYQSSRHRRYIDSTNSSWCK